MPDPAVAVAAANAEGSGAGAQSPEVEGGSAAAELDRDLETADEAAGVPSKGGRRATTQGRIEGAVTDDAVLKSIMAEPRSPSPEPIVDPRDRGKGSLTPKPESEDDFLYLFFCCGNDDGRTS